jgi:hypothetical protein
MPPNRRKARVLTNLKISEVSSVDRGAGEGCRVVMRKRDGKPDYEALFSKIFGVKKRIHDGYPMPDLRKNTDVSEPDISDEDDDADETERLSRDAEDGGIGSHRAGSEGNAGGGSTDQLERAERAMKEKSMQTHSELMSAVVKRYGIVAFCKSVEKGDVRVSEHELTRLISEAAQRENSTFEKLFCAQDEQGVTLRKAINAARDAQFISRVTTKSVEDGMPGVASLAPRVTGGRAAQAVNDPKSALAELQKLVDQQRAQHPTLTEAGAWDKVYTDPRNSALVQRERHENRPVAAW